MRLVHVDLRAGEVKLVCENTEDLWHLERVLEAGDVVESKSQRRFKTSEGESGEKKDITVQLTAEKIEFSKHANRLRITGPIKAGHPEEYVQVGSYHTVDVEMQRPVKIYKQWKHYQLTRLKKAEKESKRPLLSICVLDDEKAVFAKLRGYGVDFELEFSSNAGGKRDENRDEKIKGFFNEITKKLREEGVAKIVVAGPGFTKDNYKKYLQDHAPELLKKLSFENTSNAERSGVYELLKNGVLAKAAEEEQAAKEVALMEKLMTEISRSSGLAAYGLEEIQQAVSYGAIEHLMIVDELVRTNKEVEKILEEAEAKRTAFTIFSAENDSGRQLSGLGGIAGLLRFKIK